MYSSFFLEHVSKGGVVPVVDIGMEEFQLLMHDGHFLSTLYLHAYPRTIECVKEGGVREPKKFELEGPMQLSDYGV